MFQLVDGDVFGVPFDLSTLDSVDSPRHIGGTWAWAKFVENFYGFEARIVALSNKEELTAYCAVNTFTKSFNRSPELLSGAFLDYGDFHLFPTTKPRLEKLDDVTYEIPLVVRRTTSYKDSKRTHQILHLPSTSQAFLESISSKARYDIRKSSKLPFTCTFDLNEIDVFYKLYLSTMKRFGTPAHSIEYFDSMIKHFPNQIEISVLRCAEIPMSANFGIHWGNSYIHMYSANDLSDGGKGSADKLFYELVCHLIGRQTKFMWLGRSLRNSGVERYKAKWQPFSYGYEEVRIKKSLTEKAKVSIIDKKIARFLSLVWKRIPHCMSNTLGPMIRRRLP
jgi:hypothetical protein